MDGLRELRSIDIRDKQETPCAIRIMLESFISHDRPKVRASDADVDDVPNRFPCVAGPLIAPDAMAEVSHAIEDGVDIRNYIFSVDLDDGVSRGSEGGMKYRSILGDVDGIPSKHRINGIPKP